MKLLWLTVILVLSSCAGIPMYNDTGCRNIMECRDIAEPITFPTHEELLKLPPAEVMPVVAVYQFLDKTGQRKQGGGIASFSTATTQGGTELLIDALKTAGGGTWFRVVERAGIDNLVRERQIVRSTRDEHKKQNPDDEEVKQGIQPLLFAGIIIEGAIIGYDSNEESGGRGARYLGIGRTTQYKRDVVTVS